MKSVKTILLGAMVAVIVFSVNSVSTYSAFTSDAASNSNMFQTGTLKVTLNGDTKDTYKMLNLNYGKFGVGDSISRDFYIKNCGSLPFISKLSFLDENNQLFNYLRCEVNIYYKENSALETLEYKHNMYNGTLIDFSKSAMVIQYEKDKLVTENSVLAPSQSLRCEIIFTLPEDIILPDEVVNEARSDQDKYSSNVSNSNESIGINIHSTQVNNTSFK